MAGAACIISNASPLAKSSAMSMRVTSLILYLRISNAAEAPTFPAPIIDIIIIMSLCAFSTDKTSCTLAFCAIYSRFYILNWLASYFALFSACF